ncbi:hypothetical protein ES708_29604 [subsurface metagenome]
MEPEVKVEAKVEPEACKFTGYLNDEGKIVIETETDACRRLVVDAGKELGVEVVCGPCNEVARKLVARLKAKQENSQSSTKVSD